MAWELAGYGIAAAAIMMAASIMWGMAAAVRTLRRLDRTAANLSEEATAALRQCRELADEAGEAIAVARQHLHSFTTLAEGARLFGEAIQTAAQTAVHVSELCREHLTFPFASRPDKSGAAETGQAENGFAGRWLRSLWHAMPNPGSGSNCCKRSGTSADPSEGE